jgi:glutamate N-acetyltransferase/amino-acid N-acetyltransferase
MKPKFKLIAGSVVAPKGFLAAGVFCDIKRLGTGKGSQKGKKRDLALIVSQIPASVAGMFTTNQVCAAPVKVCIAHLQGGAAQANVVQPSTCSWVRPAASVSPCQWRTSAAAFGKPRSFWATHRSTLRKPRMPS